MEIDKCVCPVVNVDGIIAAGKQFDLDITLPEDNRNVIYGVIRDFCKDPVENAVVKLIEVCGEDERRPVSHTFTNKAGEFVFGPLCPDREYEVEFWVNKVKHVKVCVDVEHEGPCLKGTKLECEKKCKMNLIEEPCKKHEEEPCEKPCEKLCEEQEKPCIRPNNNIFHR